MGLTNREKSKLRMQLNFTKDYSVPGNVIEGKQLFNQLRHWAKEPKDYDLPRGATVDILSFRLDEEGNEIKAPAVDTVVLYPQEYEYLLDLLRMRIEHIKTQPGAMSRGNLLQEHMFVVQLLCRLDI